MRVMAVLHSHLLSQIKNLFPIYCIIHLPCVSNGTYPIFAQEINYAI
jgi:hypothetical protein